MRNLIYFLNDKIVIINSCLNIGECFVKSSKELDCIVVYFLQRDNKNQKCGENLNETMDN